MHRLQAKCHCGRNKDRFFIEQHLLDVAIIQACARNKTLSVRHHHQNNIIWKFLLGTRRTNNDKTHKQHFAGLSGIWGWNFVYCVFSPIGRTVSEYCSARVSRAGLSTKYAMEPYSDNLLNRTQNTSELYSDKEKPLKRALRRLLC